MHTPEYYMGRIERMLDDLLDTQPHRDDLLQNIYDSYVNLAESRDGLLAACKAVLAWLDGLENETDPDDPLRSIRERRWRPRRSPHLLSL